MFIGAASSGMTCEERIEFFKNGRAAAKERGTKAIIEHCETTQLTQAGTNDKEGTKRIWKPMLYWTQQGFSETTVKDEGGGEHLKQCGDTDLYGMPEWYVDQEKFNKMFTDDRACQEDADHKKVKTSSAAGKSTVKKV